MTLIPSGTRFDAIRVGASNLNKRSSLVNTNDPTYSIEDIAATVEANLPPTPPSDDTLVSFLKFSATEVMPGFPGNEITNLVEFKNDALINPGDVQLTFAGASAGYSIRLLTSLPNPSLYDWAIEVASVSAIPFITPAGIVGADYSQYTPDMIGQIGIYSTVSSLPMNYTIDNIVVRVTAKLKP